MKKPLLRLNFLFLLLLGSLLFTRCSKEHDQDDQLIEKIVPDQNGIKTAGKGDIMDALKNHKSANTRSSEDEFVGFDIDQLNYEDLLNSDQELAVIPAQTKYENVFSRILALTIDDTLQTIVFNMVPDEGIVENGFSGKIIITDLGGSFLNGYRLSNDTLVSQFVAKAEKSTNSNNKRMKNGTDCDENYNPGSTFCEEQLEEVVITGESHPVDDVPIELLFLSDGTPYYFDPNNVIYGGGGDGEYGGSSNSSDSDPSWEYHSGILEHYRLKNNLTDPCAKNIFTELAIGLYYEDPLKPEIVLETESLQLNFSESILKLFNDSKIYNYNIKNGSLTNSLSNASTIGLTTTVSNSYIVKATQLSIARTMIHEMVHAYLNVKYYEAMSLNNDLDFKLKLEEYAKDHGISNINSGEFQHDFMSQYINAMAFSLYQWDSTYGTGGLYKSNGNLDWDYYYKMAGAGLVYKNSDGNYQYSSSFINLFSSDDRTKAEQIWKNEMENKNARGSKCN